MTLQISNIYNSTSTTVTDLLAIIMQGTFNGKPVFIKTYINPIYVTDFEFYETRGLHYENEIYNYITCSADKDNHISDYFVNMVHGGIDENILNYCDEAIKPEIYKIIRRMYKIGNIKLSNHIIKLNYFVTEHDPSMCSLNQYIKKNDKTISLNDFQEIIFEILYAIYIMNIKLNIIHNDLHFNNILIKKLDIPIDKYYYKHIDLHKTKHFIIKIFDFDTSYSPKIGNNESINEVCISYGSCNSISTKDPYLLVMNLLINYYYLSNIESFYNIIECLVDNIQLIDIMEIQINDWRNKKNNIPHLYSFCDWSIELARKGAIKKYKKTKCGGDQLYPDLHIILMLDRYFIAINP